MFIVALLEKWKGEEYLLPYMRETYPNNRNYKSDLGFTDSMGKKVIVIISTWCSLMN